MDPLPEHVVKNRIAWGKMAPNFAEPGRRSWATQTINWGIWDRPEAELGALRGIPLEGIDAIELGCGTAYFSAWLAKAGARPVGIDITPEQLANARQYQAEFGIEFPLIEGSAEAVPLPDASFDLALSEYGASIWCDPYRWIPEAARLLRPGGHLVFLRNGFLSMLCIPATGATSETLQRDQFGIHRLEWDDDGSVEFTIPHGEMIRLLRANGFEIEDLIEIQAPPDSAGTRFEYVTADWAKRWPSEEIWRAKKR